MVWWPRRFRLGVRVRVVGRWFGCIGGLVGLVEALGFGCLEDGLVAS